MPEILSEIEIEIITAFRGREWDKCIKLVELSRDEALIEERNSEIERCKADLAKRKEALTGKAQIPSDFKPRRIDVQVTYGSLDHSYLLVSGALRAGVLIHSEKLTIDIPA